MVAVVVAVIILIVMVAAAAAGAAVEAAAGAGAMLVVLLVLKTLQFIKTMLLIHLVLKNTGQQMVVEDTHMLHLMLQLV